METAIESFATDPDDSDNQQLSEVNSANVLIVDDDPGILRSLSQLLSISCKNFNIKTAASAEDALVIARNKKVDIVITDLKLPKMSGLQLARKLSGVSPDTRSILMTAYGNNKISTEASDIGCVGYVEKPFDIEQLLQHVNEAFLQLQGGLRAELSGLNMIEVISLYQKQFATTALNVVAGDQSGVVLMQDGVICHAEFNGFEGLDALQQILICGNGLVSTIEFQEPGRRTLSIDMETLRAIADAPSHASTNTPTVAEQVTKESDFQPDGPTSEVASVLRGGNAGVFANGESTEGDYTLQPEGPPPPSINIPTARERRESKLRSLVNAGIDHFRNYRLDEARTNWLAALKLDPDCGPAKKNLEILENVLQKRQILQ